MTREKWKIPEQRGALLVLTALLLPVFFACAGVAVDLGSMYAHKSNLQNAVDAAALAGAAGYIAGEETAEYHPGANTMSDEYLKADLGKGYQNVIDKDFQAQTVSGKTYYRVKVTQKSPVEKIVAPLGRHIDEASPLVDARLPDGSRVNIIIPPLSLIGPCITIRKFSQTPLSIENLVSFGTLSEDMARFLRGCVKAKLNIMVSGGTGSGKTTTLNVLSSFIPSDERIVTIEDAAELRLEQPHVVTLEARPANIEGKGAITIRDLVKNALRMRPDRIIVGEARSGEALDMLQAMNTGHDGSLTTAHANSPRDVLSRLETMVLMSGLELPVRAIRDQISSALDLIVHQARIQDGSRKITYITEVQKMEGDVIVLQDLYRYRQTGFDDSGKALGVFEPTGLQPQFLSKFKAHNVELPRDLMRGGSLNFSEEGE